MKTRERKQKDLNALTEQFKNSKSAIVLSFNGLTVDKDQQFRNELRETGAKYSVVKNTLARLAVKDTPFEEATEHFVGVTSVALTDQEPMDLSKVVAKYVKEYKNIIEFKTGVMEGKVVNLEDVKAIASLPSKEELIAKVLYLLNAPAQRLATVLNAVPRDLAIVVKQISERSDGPASATSEAPAEEAKPEAEAKTEERSEEAPVESTDEKKEESAETPEEAPAVEAADEQKADEGSEDSADEKSEGSDSEEAGE